MTKNPFDNGHKNQKHLHKSAFDVAISVLSALYDHGATTHCKDAPPLPDEPQFDAQGRAAGRKHGSMSDSEYIQNYLDCDYP